MWTPLQLKTQNLIINMAITLNEHRAGVTKAVIARYSDDKAPKAGFSALFPSVTTDTKEVSIEVERYNQLMAVDVKRCTDPNRNTFDKSTEKIFIPPFFSESFDFTSCQRYAASFGSGNDPSKSDARSLIREATQYLGTLRNKILRAIEKQRADVLQTGIVTLKNGDSIDFKRKSASMKTLTSTAKWDAPSTADPFKDLLDGANFLREEGLSAGSVINAFMGAGALSNFLSNQKVQAQADIKNITRTDIGMPQFNGVTGLVFHGQTSSGDFIFNLWTYGEWYKDAAGVTQRYLGTNTVVLVPDDFVGKTAYAAVPAVMGDAISGQYVAPVEGEFHLHDVIDQVKRTWDFILESAPLVIPVSVDRIYTVVTA